MARTLSALAGMMFLMPMATAAQEVCTLCRPASSADERPLSIEIASNLVFSRLALTGKGDAQAAIDPQTGAKRTAGGVVDLGGNAIQGRARITGMPNRAVRVSFPDTVTMTSTTGGTAVLTDFATDLPPWPVLDDSGSLEFGFGGSLRLSGPVGGALRGRIPISVDYN
ncbi:MAG: DUF4402 domain-containing protein [Novosphingobium sp.]